MSRQGPVILFCGALAGDGVARNTVHLANALARQMLERFEGLVASISRVADNIAHELRTSLTRLRAQLEELAEEEDREAVRVRSVAALEEIGRLQSMFEALLRIARLESGPVGADDADRALPAAAGRRRTPRAGRRGSRPDLRRRRRAGTRGARRP